MTGEPVRMSFTFVLESVLPTNPEELEEFVSEAKESLEKFTQNIDQKVREHLLIAAEKYEAGDYTREGNIIRIAFEEEKVLAEAVQA